MSIERNTQGSTLYKYALGYLCKIVDAGHWMLNAGRWTLQSDMTPESKYLDETEVFPRTTDQSPLCRQRMGTCCDKNIPPLCNSE